jgi:hypothetical protein
MASTSEKTHAKNLENTHVARTISASIGAPFKPNNALISLAALEAFEQEFANRMQAINAAIPAEQAAVSAQIAAFKAVSPRVAKILKAAKGLGLAPEFIGSLQATANRVNGVRITAKTPDNLDTPDVDESKSNASVSRRSYAGLLESLDLLDEQLKSNPDYKPNETEYQSAAITAWVDELRNIHNAAVNAKINTRTTRTDRNAFAYNPTDGLLVRMNALKAYAETILDKTDLRLKQLKGLKFKDYSK